MYTVNTCFSVLVRSSATAILYRYSNCLILDNESAILPRYRILMPLLCSASESVAPSIGAAEWSKQSRTYHQNQITFLSVILFCVFLCYSQPITGRLHFDSFSSTKPYMKAFSLLLQYNAIFPQLLPTDRPFRITLPYPVWCYINPAVGILTSPTKM